MGVLEKGLFDITKLYMMKRVIVCILTSMLKMVNFETVYVYMVHV
jgi:hypothetical protein